MGWTTTVAEVAAVMPWFWPTLALVLGACVGSFLNVVIYRLPAKRSVVHPGSTCACGRPIAWYDNLPILSWLLLRGRARCCGRPFSIRYPLVEAVTGGLFLASWMVYPPPVALALWVFIGMMIPAAMIDLDTMEIPNRFSIGGFAVGVLASALVPSLHGLAATGFWQADALRGVLVALLGGLVGSAILTWIAIVSFDVFKREGMGFGDVKLLGAVGAFAGWQGALFTIFGGAIVGLFFEIGRQVLVAISPAARAAATAAEALPSPAPVGDVVAAPTPASPTPAPALTPAAPTTFRVGQPIPFGPSLVVAALVYLLWLRPMVDRELALVVATLFRR